MEWWMASSEEVKEITTCFHIAEAMASDRDDPIALTSDMLCRPLRYCRDSDVIEIIREKHHIYLR